MSVTAYIALGSNLGDRCGYLDQALEALRCWPGIHVGRVSTYYETEPVGGPAGQGNYHNAAAEIVTALPPEQLLTVLQQVEQQFGRIRTEPSGPRTLDLDLLLYGDLICDFPGLAVPHPRMAERWFVLAPLAEIAPHAVHPTSGRTVKTLLEKLRHESGSVRGRAGERFTAPGRELAGLRAAVTGSTSGIGKAVALELARAGADVIIHGRRAHSAAEAVETQVTALGSRSALFLADLRGQAECRALAHLAWQEWQGLDIWVNNAGADTLTGDARHWSFEQKLAELLAVDVTATILLGRDIGQRMKEGGGGCVVNMGWDQAEIGMEGDSGQLFGAAKAAVMAFTRSLALTLAPQVRVNCVAPGWIRTAWGETASARWQDRVRRETPMARWGTPEDVAGAIRWLVSPAACFITGQVIRVNGGAVR
jgi:2-amino-4-hydroxy-6-hydroxymethyldihydropteridine diphosphokinase